MFIYFIHFVTVEGNFFSLVPRTASMIGDFNFFMTFVVSNLIFSHFRQFSFHSWWWLCAIVVNQWFIYSILHFNYKKVFFWKLWIYFFCACNSLQSLIAPCLKFLDLKFKNKSSLFRSKKNCKTHKIILMICILYIRSRKKIMWKEFASTMIFILAEKANIFYCALFVKKWRFVCTSRISFSLSFGVR